MLLFAWSLALVGSLISEYTTRRRMLAELEAASQKAAELAGEGRTSEAARVLESYKSSGQVSTALSEMAASLQQGVIESKLDKILQDAELRMARAVEPVRIGAKVGPILGLMGTLIPMGPALIGLSQGDIKSMADNLVIAFATTVIGLVVGGICYSSLVIKSRWYRQDLSDLEYATDIMRGRIYEAK